jgi:hypothetical protein
MPTVESVMRLDAIFEAEPSKSPGDEMPSVNRITCFSLATVSARASPAISMAGYMLVPPLACTLLIRSRM